ncbi:MAG: shikimate dehydrogenase family protein [Christensenellales bacterium]|jgi:shikimate dehydrogenase
MSIIDTNALILGVVGDPVAHSVSPLVHNTIFDYYDINAVYLPFHVKQGDLNRFRESLPMMNMVGFNVTMPHKAAILPYLYELSDTVSLFGAANTVRVENEKLYGHMFDGDGLVLAIKNEGVDLFDKRVVVLGAGDVTGTICDALAREGVQRITLLNRTVSKAENMASLINLEHGIETYFGGLTPNELEVSCHEADILIQASSLGMKHTGADYRSLAFINELPENAIVMDVIYNPIETEILRHARRRKLHTIDGLGMLLFQAMLVLNCLLGLKVDKEAYEKARTAAHKVLTTK